MLGIVRKLKSIVKNTSDYFYVNSRKKNEQKKYKNPKRVEIYSEIKLTREQQRAIDKLYLENYGKKIPYVWHQNFMAHSGKFDEKYFPELLYIPEFEYFMNLWPAYGKVFSDKNVLPELAQRVGVKMPKTVLSITKGLIRDCELNSLTLEEACNRLFNYGRVFVKPSVDSCSGVGCFIADFQNDKDKISGKTTREFISSLGYDVVVQEILVCHESISKIYDGSVNTFRIITYRWRDAILHMPIIMRIGQGGSFLDNAHAGGMFIALNDDGVFHKMAMTEFNLQFAKHPDTGFVFEGAKIELLPNVIDAAKRMHEVIPQLGVVNWDFTIDEFGTPVLVEANLFGGSVWLPEMAHGCGAFGEKTNEVLRWLKFMKQVPVNEREKFAFGKNE